MYSYAKMAQFFALISMLCKRKKAKCNLFRRIAAMAKLRPHSNICGGEPGVVVTSPAGQAPREVVHLMMIASTCHTPLCHLEI